MAKKENQICKSGGINKKTIAVDSKQKKQPLFTNLDKGNGPVCELPSTTIGKQKKNHQSSILRAPLREETRYRAGILLRTYGVEMGYQGRGILQDSVTKGCDRGEIMVASIGSRVPATIQSVVAVTEQRDEPKRIVTSGRLNNSGIYR